MRALPRVFIGVLFGSLLVAAFSASPASAGPGTVKRVQVTAASTTTLTLTWSKVSGSGTHQVFVASNYAMKKAQLRRAGKSNSYRVKGLKPGRTYCFQVRKVRGSSIGKRSERTCKPTIRTKGATSGTKLRVVTYNVCSSKCTNRRKYWSRGVANLRAARPDVIAFQEAGDAWMADQLAPVDEAGNPSGAYAYAVDESQRILIYKRSTFDMAMTFAEPSAGMFSLGDGEYAVWAELINKSTRKHLIATSTHLTSGKTRSAAIKRKRQTTRLLANTAAVNPEKFPVIHAGDFNSNKNRGSLDTVAAVLKSSGYYDAFDLATWLKNPNWNSSLDSKGNIRYAVKWGDHVDHVFVRPAVGVRAWQKLGSQSKPYPSDHFAVAVDLTVK